MNNKKCKNRNSSYRTVLWDKAFFYNEIHEYYLAFVVQWKMVKPNSDDLQFAKAILFRENRPKDLYDNQELRDQTY